MADSDQLVQEIAQDRHSGATALTRRAAEALRQRLDEADGLDGFGEFADRLVEAQPAMASIRNLAERAKAAARVGSIANTRNAIDQVLQELSASTEAIAHEAQALLSRVDRVVTISASSTVAVALRDAAEANPQLSVVCPESRPLNEGVTLASSLAQAGIAATVCADALSPSMAREADLVLVGGDALAPNGLANKVGTFPLALAARYADVPCIALISRLKMLDRFDPAWIADMDPREVADVTATSLEVVNRYFELTPPALLTHVVAEDGVMSPSDLG
ncbi:MAG: translation initiation factor eIF-2B [Candidatus Bipolaricaulia bacterium]